VRRCGYEIPTPEGIEMTDTNSNTNKSTAGGVAAIVSGSVIALLALALVAGGGAVVWGKAAKQDSAGYFTTHTHRFGASTYALTQDKMEIGNVHWLPVRPWFRIRAASDKPVFVGIARTADVNRYLAAVAHTQTQNLEYDPFRVDYETIAGTKAPAAPATRTIWAASATGTHDVSVNWRLQKGTWSVVVMNADASRGVHADVDLGAKVPHLGWILAGLFGGGGILGAASALLIVIGARNLGGGGTVPVAEISPVSA
jgi:hypothetical protein